MLLAHLAILLRAFYLQVYHRAELLVHFNRQFIRTATLYPYRGQILDRQGTPMALNVLRWDVAVTPKKLKSKRDFLKVCQLLELGSAPCLTHYHRAKTRGRFTWIARDLKLKDQQQKTIKQLLRSVEGIQLESKLSRYYPNGDLMGQLLGFVNMDNKGISGLEYTFDEKLKGRPKYVRYLRDAKGTPVKMESIEFASPGDDLKLSIDRDLQSVAEKYLKEAITEFNAKGGGIGVMNAYTGELLAMASAPFIDPNHYQDYPSSWLRPAFLTDPFEPGSIFKLFTIAAALESNRIPLEKKFNCEQGQYKVGNHTIKEAAGHRYESLTMKEIFETSSNIGTTKVAFHLGAEPLYALLKKMRIGQKTGIELSGESKGIWRHSGTPTPIQLATLSFGQGVSTTVLQMLAAYSAVANGGYWIKPTIFHQEAQDLRLAQGERVLTEQTTAALEKMLEGVVTEGTANNARSTHYRMAGKTGTAQKVGSAGRYDGIISGFIGYPLDTNQRYVVFVYIDGPEGKIYGNDVAAPVFAKMMNYLLFKEKQSSSQHVTQQLAALDQTSDAPLAVLEHAATEVSSVTLSQSAANASGSATSVSAQGQLVIPNFLGLDKESAKQLAAQRGVGIVMRGFGVVVKQSPAPGQQFSRGDDVEVEIDFDQANF